jgi:hypothetical protein
MSSERSGGKLALEVVTDPDRSCFAEMHSTAKPTGRMTNAILHSVKRQVTRLAPVHACGVCLTERLADIDASAVAIALNELAVMRGFGWTQAMCGLCGEARQVIGKRVNGA